MWKAWLSWVQVKKGAEYFWDGLSVIGQVSVDNTNITNIWTYLKPDSCCGRGKLEGLYPKVAAGSVQGRSHGGAAPGRWRRDSAARGASREGPRRLLCFQLTRLWSHLAELRKTSFRAGPCRTLFCPSPRPPGLFRSSNKKWLHGVCAEHQILILPATTFNTLAVVRWAC